MKAENKEAAAGIFYENLFALAPELRSLFPTEMSGQSRKFSATMVMAINSLSDWEALRPIVEALARRHLSYGVELEHYEVLQRALIATLEELSATQAEIEVWRKVFKIVAGHMITTAYPKQG